VCFFCPCFAAAFLGSVMERIRLPYRIVYLVGYFRQLPYVKNSTWI
jgi:hypothetical protein